MSFFKLFCGIFLLAWGIWCFIAVIKKLKAQALIFKDDEFIPKTIFGKYYDPIMNILLGIVCIMFGVLLIKTNT